MSQKKNGYVNFNGRTGLEQFVGEDADKHRFMYLMALGSKQISIL